METRREMCVQGAAGDHVPTVRIKQEVEWQGQVLQPMDLVNQELQLDMEPLQYIKTEANFMSKNMETLQNGCLKGAVSERVPNVLTDEVQWLAESSHGKVNTDSLESIESEKDHMSTPDAQTPNDFYKPSKTELTSDDEFVDEKKDTNSGSSTETNNQQILAPAHGQSVGTSITDKESEEFACHLCRRTFSKKFSLIRHWKVHTKQGHTKVKASTFICEACGATFTEKTNLKIHMLRKHLDTVQSSISGPQTAKHDSIDSDMKEFLHEGAACNDQASKEFTTERSESNADIKSRTCEICHCIYPKEYIRIHMRLAHSKPKHKCVFCSRLFKRKRDLKVHLNTHATDRKREFVCEICERDFYYKVNLTKHKKIYAQKDHPKFNCEKCLSSFTKKGNLEEHMLTNYLGKAKSTTAGLQMADNCINQTRIEEPTFKCVVCSQSFKNKYLLRGHLITHAKDRKREFTCNSCDSTFYTRDALLYHKMVHRQHLDETQQLTPQPSNDAAECMKPELISDEEFIDERNDKDSVSHAEGSQQPVLVTDDEQRARVRLAEHSVTLIDSQTRVTHARRAYKCPYCPKVCSRQEHLKNHISTHDTNRKRPYVCEQCGVTFFSRRSLRRHNGTQHSENRQPEFNCELCEKKFYSWNGLKGHMDTHAGVTFNCEVCEKSFTRTRGLKYHMAAVHTRF